MDWIGLGQQKWTHVQLCVGHMRFAELHLANTCSLPYCNVHGTLWASAQQVGLTG